MPDDPEDKDAKLRAEVERLSAEYGADAIKRFLKKAQKKRGPAKRRGRPLLADEVALSTMADLLHRKSVDSDTEAAEAVAMVVEGASHGAKIHRLCRKLREGRAKLMAEAAERHRPKTVTELRAERRTPGDVSELRAEYQRLVSYDLVRAEIARNLDTIRQQSTIGMSAALEYARATEASRRAIMEQIRTDQETLRTLALGANWRRFLRGD